MEILISRRKMLKATAGVLALGSVVPAILSSCKKTQTQSLETNNKEEQGLKACVPAKELNQEQEAIRKNLRYVDETPVSSRTCDNCRLYTMPQGQDVCGGCQIVPGPIHPKGYCISWLARM
jgi:hypothetical protein